MTNLLQTIMRDFARAKGLPDPGHSADATYTLVFDRRWMVTITEDPNRKLVHLFSSSLRQNPGAADWSDTATDAPACADGSRARPVVHHAGELVLLHASIASKRLDQDSFAYWLESFVEQVAQWSASTQALASADSP